METWRRWALLLACATTALLLAPVGASAKPGYIVTKYWCSGLYTETENHWPSALR